MIKPYIFENPYELTNELVKEWIRIAQESIEQRGRFVAALSGGTTPIEFYSKLAGVQEYSLWPKTHVFMIDERFVPVHHADSNFRLIKKNLLDFVPIPQSHIHRIPTDVENAAVAAEEYKNDLVHFFSVAQKGLPRFDFILLGIGEDGHTASLFPMQEDGNAPAASAVRLTLPVSLNYLEHDRVTLTLPVINNGRHIFFFVRGKSKSEILKRILEKKEDLPASRVRPVDGTLSYFVDAPAAEHVSLPEPTISD